MEIQVKFDLLSPQARQQVEDFVDFLLSRENHSDQLLKESITRGLDQSGAGRVKSHEEVIAEIRSNFN